MNNKSMKPFKNFYYLTTNDTENVHVLNTNGIYYCYKHQPASSKQRMRLPDGCAELLFVYQKEKPAIYLQGPLKKLTFTQDDPAPVFGVVFLPGILPAPLIKDINFLESFDQRIPVDPNIPGFQDILNTTHFEEQIQRCLQAFEGYEQEYTPLIKDIMTTIIQKKGDIHLNTIYQDLGYSRQYINQIFRMHIGMRPKYFCKVLRFRHLIENILTYYPEKNLNQCTKECGYYDQSHMYKDFKEFTDYPPDLFCQTFVGNIECS